MVRLGWALAVAMLASGCNADFLGVRPGGDRSQLIFAPPPEAPALLEPALFDLQETGPFLGTPAPAREALSLPRPKDPYLALRYDVDFARRQLALRKAAGDAVTDDGVDALTKWLPTLMTRWIGTKYSYNGTSQVPKTGKIACGYFVSTVLEHAGFRIERVDLARQPSEQIVRTLVPDPNIERFRMVPSRNVVKRVEELGTGVYIVGLDTHVGFLVNAPKEPVRFCHSTGRYRRGVVCELATASESLPSRYTVLGKLDSAEMIDAWLARETLPAARKGKPQPKALIAHAVAEGPSSTTGVGLQ